MVLPAGEAVVCNATIGPADFHIRRCGVVREAEMERGGVLLAIGADAS